MRLWENEPFNVEKIMLERMKFGVYQELNRFDLDIASEIEVEEYVRSLSRNVAYRFQTEIFGQKLEDIKYPANWKEAFKERWFPKKLLKKYPVKYTRLSAKALYPQLKLPAGQYQAVFHVQKMNGEY